MSLYIYNLQPRSMSQNTYDTTKFLQGHRPRPIPNSRTNSHPPMLVVVMEVEHVSCLVAKPFPMIYLPTSSSLAVPVLTTPHLYAT